MQRQGFEEYARLAASRDSRYDADAYLFLRDALDHTLGGRGKSSGRHQRHVRGPELLNGFRELALQEFGPLAMTVLESWGLRRCEDVGEMVFNLIGVGAFGSTSEDSKEDFAGGYDFAEAFRRPFLPTGGKAVPLPRTRKSGVAARRRV
jgi:uncharacterized repeat protein (TIGR04138 family)